MAIVDETGVAIRADFTKFDGDVTKGAKSASTTFAKEFKPTAARDAAGRFLPSGKDGETSGKSTAKGFTSSLGSSLRGGIASLHDTVKHAVVGLAAGAAAVFTVEGISEFLHTSVERATQFNKLGAITAQTIKGTGSAAHVTAGQVNELADATARKTGVDAEQVHTSENVLLTFTKVRNEVGKGNDIFNRATGLVNDLAVATGRGARPAALALGKALQDPVKQVTALTRIGVIFTKGQKDQIAAMVKNGDTVGAQKLILTQLQQRYGGVAAAAATTGQKFRVAVQSIQDTIGHILTPVINFAAGGLITLVDGLNSPAFASFGHTITAGLTQVVAGVRLFVGAFTGAGSSAADTLHTGFINPIINLGATARDIFDGVIVPAFHDVVAVIRDDIIPGVQNLLAIIAPLAVQLAGAVGPVVIAAFGALASILVNQIGPAFLAITGFLKDHAVAVRTVVVAILAGVAAYKAIALAKAIITAITSVTKIWAAAQAALNAVMDANPILLIVVGLAALAAGLIYAYKNSQTFRNVVTAALHGVQSAFHAVVGAGAAVVNALVTAFDALTGATSTAFNAVVATLSAIGSAIASAVAFIGRIVGELVNVITFPTRLAIALLVAIIAVGVRALTGPFLLVFNEIRTIITTAFSFYVSIVRTELGAVLFVVRAVWSLISAVFSTALAALRVVVSAGWHALVAVVSGIAGALAAAARAVWRVVVTAVTSVLSTLSGAVSKPLTAAVSTVAGFGAKVFKAATTVFGKITSAAEGIVGDMAGVAGDIVSGLINGITGLGGSLYNAITKFIDDNVPGPIKKLLHIGSPSKLMEQYGIWTGQGLQQGILSQAKPVATAAAQLATAATAGARAGGVRTSAARAAQGGTTVRAAPSRTGGPGGPALVIQDYHAAPGASPRAVAEDIALIARSRGGSLAPAVG